MLVDSFDIKAENVQETDSELVSTYDYQTSSVERSQDGSWTVRPHKTEVQFKTQKNVPKLGWVEIIPRSIRSSGMPSWCESCLQFAHPLSKGQLYSLWESVFSYLKKCSHCGVCICLRHPPSILQHECFKLAIIIVGFRTKDGKILIAICFDLCSMLKHQQERLCHSMWGFCCFQAAWVTHTPYIYGYSLFFFNWDDSCILGTHDPLRTSSFKNPEDNLSFVAEWCWLDGEETTDLQSQLASLQTNSEHRPWPIAAVTLSVLYGVSWSYQTSLKTTSTSFCNIWVASCQTAFKMFWIRLL